MEEEFKISRVGRRGYRRGRRGGHYRGFYRRGFRPYYYPYYSYPYYYSDSCDKNCADCIYAAGKCPEDWDKAAGELGEGNVRELCKQTKVQNIVQKFPEKCREESYERYINQEAVGVL